MKDNRQIKSYVIRGGRLSEGRKRALTELYGIYGLQFADEEINFSSIDPPGVTFRRVVVEIGFGTGEVTAELAESNPETLYIGIEVFPAGVGNLLRIIHQRGLQNIRIIQHDAAEVVASMLPDSSVDGFHVFFPDPWPKKKHHKRRLLNADFVELIRDKLNIGGYLYVVTDWEEYADQILANCVGTSGLEKSGDPPPLTRRPQTKFEIKGLEKNHPIRELHFTKRTAP